MLIGLNSSMVKALILGFLIAGIFVGCTDSSSQIRPDPTETLIPSQEDPQASANTTRGLEQYLNFINPLMEQHGDTTQIVNEANVRIQQQSASETSLSRQAALLDEWINQLEWAVPRLRQDLDEAQRTTPPRTALAFHAKLIEAMQYDLIGISGLLSHSVRFRNTGFNDFTALNDANDQLLRGRLAANEMGILLVEMSRE